MRTYWAKIILGALVIFLVGYAGVSFVRRQVNLVRSDADINIPLAFVPFTLDGSREGTFRGIRIERSAPEQIAGFRLRVRLADSADVDRLRVCRIRAVAHGSDFDPADAFECMAVDASDSALVAFGRIVFETRAGESFTVPLLLDSAVVAEMRSHKSTAAVTERTAQSEARAAREQAARIESQVRRTVDSALAEVKAATPVPPRTPSP